MWIKNDSKNPLTPYEGEVLAYHPKWIDEFNYEGIRVGFVNDQYEFVSTEWSPVYNEYVTIISEMPTMYLVYPPVKEQQKKYRMIARASLIITIICISYFIHKLIQLYHK